MINFFIQLIAELKSKSKEGKPLYIKVKILPQSAKNEIIEQLEDESYKIRIKAPAVQGKANAELCRFLKKELGASEVVIVSGGRERIKLIRIAQ